MRTQKTQTCFSSVPRGTLQIHKPQCRSTKGARFSTPPSSPLWYFSYHTSLHSTAHNSMFGQFQILPLSFSFSLLSVSLMTHSLSLPFPFYLLTNQTKKDKQRAHEHHAQKQQQTKLVCGMLIRGEINQSYN